MVAKKLEDASINQTKAFAVIDCESGWNNTAKNWNPPYTDKKGKYHPGTWDYGLWQINDVHHLTKEQRFDPVQATDYAIKLIKQEGFHPWVCSRLKR